MAPYFSFSFFRIDEVRQEFRVKASSIAKNDYQAIEHAIRYGIKQKKLIDMPGFKGVTTHMNFPLENYISSNSVL